MNQQELDITLARESEAEAKASRKAWQLAASLLLTALTLGLLIYVYRNSKKQKQMNNLLLEKNEEINLQKIIIEEKILNSQIVLLMPKEFNLHFYHHKIN
ncbi:MAG: hypothetical protein IPM74_17990 [Crocinitomicaceae bacterium]|nr:hypothetical protein [Crocinitomicaceae bacterium]